MATIKIMVDTNDNKCEACEYLRMFDGGNYGCSIFDVVLDVKDNDFLRCEKCLAAEVAGIHRERSD